MHTYQPLYPDPWLYTALGDQNEGVLCWHMLGCPMSWCQP